MSRRISKRVNPPSSNWPVLLLEPTVTRNHIVEVDKVIGAYPSALFAVSFVITVPASMIAPNSL